MIYTLADCRTGQAPVYRTQLEILRQDDTLVFRFDAEHSWCFCPYHGYNRNHYEGDVCEVFLGTDRSTYYEVEVSPDNDLFFGKVHYRGTDPYGKPDMRLELLPRQDCFVRSQAERTETGYRVQITVDLERFGPEQEIFFNAFRIETDGGEPEKHLFALRPTGQPRFHVPAAFVSIYDILS